MTANKVLKGNIRIKIKLLKMPNFNAVTTIDTAAREYVMDIK